MYRTVTPKEAHDLIEAEGYRYVDVRSEQEFAMNHAEGAVNIPVMHTGPGGMAPNHDFARVVEANYPKDAKLVLACKSGGRSARAAGILEAAGFTNVLNMDGGFDGRFGPMGDLQQAGWSQEQYPTSATVDDSNSYASLASRAR